ncbi:hypothetical protein N657DRAFT_501243 [Parathielavia appendiculata]|uniref:Uncharacterized protein n=1 Tax=Parathielavia appendiculata TaxID=2587402 RepID=A0AAN6TX56_9PEZI|nr:hypothetical protein N657DRAFT_501243 [Parathielavia appendiculata]
MLREMSARSGRDGLGIAAVVARSSGGLAAGREDKSGASEESTGERIECGYVPVCTNHGFLIVLFIADFQVPVASHAGRVLTGWLDDQAVQAMENSASVRWVGSNRQTVSSSVWPPPLFCSQVYTCIVPFDRVPVTWWCECAT